MQVNVVNSHSEAAVFVRLYLMLTEQTLFFNSVCSVSIILNEQKDLRRSNYLSLR